MPEISLSEATLWQRQEVSSLNVQLIWSYHWVISQRVHCLVIMEVNCIYRHMQCKQRWPSWLLSLIEKSLVLWNSPLHIIFVLDAMILIYILSAFTYLDFINYDTQWKRTVSTDSNTSHICNESAVAVCSSSHIWSS